MSDQPAAIATPPSAGARFIQIGTALIVAVAGAGTLAGAWYFQLVVGLAPCPLCLEQRVPYYLVVPVALVAVVLALIGKVGGARVALGLAAMLMALAAFLGAYHAGVEWGFWAGPASCSGGAIPASSGNLLEQLQEARVVSCSEAPWRLLGISLAGYNALIAGCLTLIAMRGAAAR